MKFEELIEQSFNAYPPDGTVEQFERRQDMAFRACYKNATEEANLFPVNEIEHQRMFKLAKLMWEAGRIFELTPIPVE